MRLLSRCQTPAAPQVAALSQALATREKQLGEQSALLTKVSAPARLLGLPADGTQSQPTAARICQLASCVDVTHARNGLPVRRPPSPAQVAEAKELQRATIEAQKQLHAGQLRHLNGLLEQVGAGLLGRGTRVGPPVVARWWQPWTHPAPQLRRPPPVLCPHLPHLQAHTRASQLEGEASGLRSDSQAAEDRAAALERENAALLAELAAAREAAATAQAAQAAAERAAQAAARKLESRAAAESTAAQVGQAMAWIA